MSKFISHLFVTTDPDSLFYRLEKKLFDSEGLFRQIVIVPSGLVKEKIYENMLEQGIATGFKVFELGPGIDYLMRAVRFDDKKGHSFPAPMLFALHLQAIIKECLRLKDPIFDLLKEYVYSKQYEECVERRIQDLSEALSLDFLHYGLYAGEELNEWLGKKSWQGALFKKAFVCWDYPYHAFSELSTKNKSNLELEVHLFGFSFIPLVYEKFFSQLSSFFQFHYYYLTPSAYFWGEALSQKELISLQKIYKSKGVRTEEIEELKNYQKQEHQLLTNFGKQTQRRYNYLLDLDLLGQEFLREEFFFEEDLQKEKKLLFEIKRELFNGKANDAVTLLSSGDNSIEIHKSPSRKREVETLLHLLMNLSDNKSIEPSDILVLAPDISVYFPFIRQIFEFQSPFSIEVSDLEIQTQSSFLQGLWTLVSLYESRFEQQDIFALLTIDSILNRFEISKEEVLALKTFCEKANILWGYDGKHRLEILSKIEKTNESYHCIEQGTWSYGLSRLLMGLVVTDEAFLDEDSWPFYPIQGVSVDESKLLGKFICFIESLYEEKEDLTRGKKSLGEWTLYFKSLVEKFFLFKNLEEDEGLLFFRQQLKGIEQLALKIPEATFKFSSLKRLFEKTFSKKGAIFSSRNKNAIRFCSIQSQQLYPVKVLCFLGMEEDSFPSKQPVYPLREIDVQLMDPYPQLVEEQRQVLLDAAIYTKENLIFSYCSLDEKDGKEKEISFLLQEWVEYFDAHYSYESKKVSEYISYSHKGFAFHCHELAEDLRKKHYSLRDHSLAEAYYQLEKEKKRFIPEFYYPYEEEILLEKKQEKGSVFLSRLQNFARNPLRYYMNHQLGFYLKEDKSLESKREKEFILPSLEKVIFKNDLFDHPFEGLYQKRQLEGVVPLGVFGDITKEILQNEADAFFETFKKIGIDILSVFSVELHPQCEEKTQKEERSFLVPPLEVILKDGEKIFIQGKLENLCESGMIVYGKEDLGDYLKVWPLYLTFLAIVERDFKDKIEPSLVCLKEASIKKRPLFNPLEALSAYLSYYKKGQTTPSPLMPLWADAFLLQTEEERESAIKKAFFNKQSFMHLDDYQKWCFEHLEPFCALSITQNWQKTFDSAFDSLLAWHSGGDING